MNNFIRYWLPVYVYAGVIFYLSSLSRIPPAIIEVQSNTFILHMIEYAILSILLFRAFINSKNAMFKEKAIHLAIIISILYGITDEIHQYFVPGRFSSVLDLLANSVGAGIVLTKNFFIRSKSYFKRQLRIRFSH